MNLHEIRQAVDVGKVVHWGNDSYKVIRDRHGKYLIQYTWDGSCIGLTWTDGKTMNGYESQFYIKGER